MPPRRYSSVHCVSARRGSLSILLCCDIDYDTTERESEISPLYPSSMTVGEEKVV